MVTIEVILALIVAVALVAVVAELVPVPLPLLQIAGGMALSLVPGFSRVHIDPRSSSRCSSRRCCSPKAG